ncbi:uncharacterized protein EV420DRAFT_1273200 [Desarmillaria tabescens]|uniref:Protein kinase domain-containing protein n=1 Tax=Armillaria tabescens TaxID=1929756 RepID=A0AA39K4D4_ARMTA|nr:uncharacterized protein EV420DRAFT_1273200 [Desarmillaria tabescens]KAK0454137.1 hypothetical protein EV420DRAFT_1273200 [Desarmillaria tabescens]
MKVYKRVFPRLKENAIYSDIHGTIHATRKPRTAYLDLSSAKDLGAGAGSHSKVLLGKLRLPKPLIARSSSGQFEVAVKLARSDHESHKMLRIEAKLYDSAIPQYLTRDWSGFHFLEEAAYDGDGIVPVAAVVPKFYGFYVPVHQDYTGLLSPILLMEECGTPIDVKRLTPKDRELIYSFAIRIHRCGVSQGSFFDRNVLVQPGPLSAPPSMRSPSTPSFRVIDFGRGERREDLTKREWKVICEDEMIDVKEAIYGELKRISKDARGSRKQIAFARKYWSTRKPTYG